MNKEKESDRFGEGLIIGIMIGSYLPPYHPPLRAKILGGIIIIGFLIFYIYLCRESKKNQKK